MFQVYYYAILMIFKLGNGGMSENNYEDNYLLEGYRDYLLISSSDVEMSKWCLYIMIFIRQEKLHEQTLRNGGVKRVNTKPKLCLNFVILVTKWYSFIGV